VREGCAVLKRLINKLTGRGTPAVDPNNPAAVEAAQLLESYIKESSKFDNAWSADFQGTRAAKAMNAAAPATRVKLLRLAALRLREATSPQINQLNDKRAPLATALHDLLPVLVRPELPIDAETLSALIQRAGTRTCFSVLPSAGILRAVERYAEAQPLSDDHRAYLNKLKSRIARERDGAHRKLCQRIDALLSAKTTTGGGVAKKVELEHGEPWADAVLAHMKKANAAQADAWQRLFNHAGTASGSKPSAKWLKTASTLIDGIGRKPFVDRLSTWLPLVGKPGPGRPMRGWTGVKLDPTVLSEENADVLKGVVWAAASVDEPLIARLLGDLARCASRRSPCTAGGVRRWPTHVSPPCRS
jgi:hypothetical protein